jgi:hypothetical protein
MVALFAALTLLAQASPADAGPSSNVSRPSEDSMFGSSESAPEDAGVKPALDTSLQPVADAGSSRDEAMLESRFPYKTTDQLPPDNPLTIGGLLYLRAQISATENQPPSQYQLSAPFLLDTYLDARPNDRVRAFFLVRTEYDATYVAGQANALGVALPAQQNPQFVIDQMWIKFDLSRQVFITAGKQHVKWGTAHFWFPNDLLNPVRLTPLAVFDRRTGQTMVKANLPLPNQNLNVYVLALLDGIQQATTLGKVGGAGRVEYVFNAIELGLDLIAMEGQHNRYGGDVSFGIWDFDLYADGALTNLRDNPLYEIVVPPVLDPGPGQTFFPGIYQRDKPSFYEPQVAMGLNYSFRYGNNRTVVMGGEYFYNGLGYSDPAIYPYLLANNAAIFFYLGKQYAGLYILADKPGDWTNTTVNFSTLGNLSDHTFISRIDVFQTVLTHLRFEAFFDVHYGGNGEFHYGLNVPATTFGGVSIPNIHITPPLFDAGVALRVAL